MGFVAPRSFVAPNRPVYWFPAPAPRLPVSRCALPVLLWMPSPASLAQSGFILPRAFRPFRVLLSSVRPTPPGVKRLPWGLRSLFAVLAGRIYVQGIPLPQTLPSLAFLSPSTVSASTSLVGLFHPTTTSRVLPTGVCSFRTAETPRRRPVPSRRLTKVCCLQLPTSAALLGPTLRALIHARVRVQ
jgi:hypothetical protein